MPTRKHIYGEVTVDRELAEDEFWLAEPFSRGQAFMDLILIANTEPHYVLVRGVQVRLEKGQVGRSVASLADRWRWSRNKTRAFLDELRDLRKIDFKMDNVATVITIMDYAVLNPKRTAEGDAEGDAEGEAKGTAESVAEGDAERPPEGEAKGTAESTQSIELELRDNKRIERGEPPPLRNAVSLQRALERFADLGSGYSEAEIKSAWHELTAGAVDGNWMGGRPLRPVSDWRSALESELWKRRELFSTKNQKNGAPHKPPPSGLTLEKMRDAVE